jgi:hypothetical protein
VISEGFGLFVLMGTYAWLLADGLMGIWAGILKI